MELTDYQQQLLERLVLAVERQATALEAIRQGLEDDAIMVHSTIVDIDPAALEGIAMAVKP
jgi:hypothetical protein